jgi:hypothetical protein
MVGAILVVILILALLGACQAGPTADVGVITLAVDWGLPSSSLSFFWFSAGFEPFVIQQPYCCPAIAGQIGR